MAQEAKNLMEKGSPTCSIVLTEAADGSFSEYYFYDDIGKFVKKVRHDQFESRHPIYKLKALNWKIKDTLPDYYHVLELVNDESLKPGTKRLQPKVIDELNSLKKLGITVKSPEKARVIIGSPTTNLRPIVAMPRGKYLINIETARILDYSAKEIEGQSNALLDCSYLTIYSCLGEVFKEILISDKIITFATVSDDGNYLMGSYSYTNLWDEGYDEVPDGILIADLHSGKIDYISTLETKNSLSMGSVLFADNYFQMTIGNPWSGDSCVRMYINPYDRKSYMKSYGEDRQKSRKPLFPARSFIQFEGVVEFPKQFNSFSY